MPMLKLQRCNATASFSDSDESPPPLPDEKEEEKMPSEALLTGVPIENEHQMEQMLQQYYPVYGKEFGTKEDYTEFMMLPIPDSRRSELIRVMREDQAMKKKTREAERQNRKSTRRASAVCESVTS